MFRRVGLLAPRVAALGGFIDGCDGEIARLKLASEGGTTYTFVLEGDAWAAKGKPQEAA